jgi:hypothetical protein
MVKKKTPLRSRFAAMTADEIFEEWKKAAHDGLKPGMRFAPAIFNPTGRIVRNYKRAITRRLGDTAHPFNAADHRNSTRVARDLGRICSLVAEDAGRVISVDVFDRAALLVKLHASCPEPPVLGGGTWCDTR